MENLTNLQINVSDISIVFTAYLGFMFALFSVESAIRLARNS